MGARKFKDHYSQFKAQANAPCLLCRYVGKANSYDAININDYLITEWKKRYRDHRLWGRILYR